MELIFQRLGVNYNGYTQAGLGGEGVRGDVRGGISTCVDPCSMNQSGIWLTVTIYSFMTIPLTKAN